MRPFLIYRHGANRANQSLCDKMPVAIVEAESAAEALEEESDPKPSIYSSRWLKLAPHVTAWANQTFSAVTEDKADADDWNAVVELSAQPVEHAR